jgi:hypothetical protein
MRQLSGRLQADPSAHLTRAPERTDSAGDSPPRMPVLVRVGSHLAVWLALLVPMVVVLTRGWIPSGDDAAIAIRSYQTFTLHPPLVGLVSTIGTGTGNTVFDPGPLLFWLLAVPVRIDPLHGPLWGAALLSGVVLSVAIEALWSARQWLACAVVAFTVADYLLFAPPVIENIVWNAYFPIPFFIATIALAWVVAGGSSGWWPVLVFTGSVAAQSQLIFLLPAAMLVLGAPVVAVLLGRRPARFRWLVTGLAVGVGCWLAPLLQGLGSNGNISALAGTGHGLPRMGVVWGLRVLGAIGSPSPLWLHHLSDTFFGALGTVSVNSPVAGVIVLVALGIIAMWAWRVGRRMLAALSIITLACSVAMAAGFSLVPTKNELNFVYMNTALWVMSILVWSVILWALFLLAAAAARWLTARRGFALPADRFAKWGAATVAVPVTLLAFGLVSLRSYQPDLANVGTRTSDARVLPRIATAIEKATPGRRVVVRVKEVGAPWLVSYWLTEGAAWSLEAAGWHPGLGGFARSYTGLVPQPGSDIFLVTVDPRVGIRTIRPEGKSGP